MKTLYLDCSMGAAGDMLTAALLELVPDQASVLEKLNSMGIPGVKFKAEKSVKCGITGTHMAVTVRGQEEEDFFEHHHSQGPFGGHGHCHGHGHEHPHMTPADIAHVLTHMDLPERVRRDVLAVYDIIAQAESHAHDMPVEQIHFHEVGSLDAIADVTAVCMLMDLLRPDQVLAAPIHVGSGTVHCAHGILPVPAPATAWILREVPVYSGSIQGELCTPTGAALLKYFVKDFCSMPIMRASGIGYGMGRKDFPQANCLRAMLGDTQEQQESDSGTELQSG